MNRRLPYNVRMNDEFQTTHWSAVVIAGRDSSPESQRALATLCELYWYPLYAYARRRTGSEDEAQDLTQAFFTELLEKNYVGSASQDRGRFRAFLLTALKNFMSKQWEKARAKKRGGGKDPISLDFAGFDSRWRIEPALEMTPEQCYDQQWTVTLLEQILTRLQSEFERAGQSQRFQTLRGFIIGDHGETTYAEAGEQLGISEAAAKKAASRMRQRYRELLREEIAQTVSDPEDVEDEIRSLFSSVKG